MKASSENLQSSLLQLLKEETRKYDYVKNGVSDINSTKFWIKDLIKSIRLVKFLGEMWNLKFFILWLEGPSYKTLLT